MDNYRLARIFYKRYESNKQLFSGLNVIELLFLTLREILEESFETIILIDALDKYNSGPDRDTLLNLITEYVRSSLKTK